MAASLRLSELTKLFGATRAVDRVSLAIEPGNMVALLGPSGCGKTTTLRMIAGLVEPSAGEITLGDRRLSGVPVHRRNIGMLFQNYALFPHMNVAQNIAFGLQTRGVKRAELAARVNEALELVQLGTYGERLPTQLSGGQQQRVALARALVVEPLLLLLDEPLGALDKSLRQEMQVELRALQRRLGITTVMVTHDQDEALTMADRIVIMRDGSVEQSGAPAEIYQRPASRFVASFLGASNFFRGRVERVVDGASLVVVPNGPSLTVASQRAVGSEVTVALRPEVVTVGEAAPGAGASPPNTASVTVEQIIYHGFVTHLHLRLANGEKLIAFQQNRDDAATPALPGMPLLACWPAESGQIVRDELD
ncbi:MAG TPA: ABC transporter ATP-binding protein [Stellaceae bacterium]|jgi:putative spermidine/putrescine transport system ATP-binding protein/spermidine/putrescine transport system ATP-binding protein|nr:ABC transporter ATP-binding protein [Stellaceae bacterium]